MTSIILLGFSFSDHVLVVTIIKMNGGTFSPSIYRMNTQDIQGGELKGKLESLWDKLHVETLEDKCSASLGFFKGLYDNNKISCLHGNLLVEARQKRRKICRGPLPRPKVNWNLTFNPWKSS